MGCSYFIHKSFNKAEIYNFTGNGLIHTVVLFGVWIDKDSKPVFFVMAIPN